MENRLQFDLNYVSFLFNFIFKYANKQIQLGKKF